MHLPAYYKQEINFVWTNFRMVTIVASHSQRHWGEDYMKLNKTL